MTYPAVVSFAGALRSKTGLGDAGAITWRQVLLEEEAGGERRRGKDADCSVVSLIICLFCAWLLLHAGKLHSVSAAAHITYDLLYICIIPLPCHFSLPSLLLSIPLSCQYSILPSLNGREKVIFFSQRDGIYLRRYCSKHKRAYSGTARRVNARRHRQVL
jgi:hypothetical protein